MKKKIIKVISVFMVLNIFLIPLANFAPGNQIKTVQAAEGVVDIRFYNAIVSLIGITAAGIAAMSPSFSIPEVDMIQLKNEFAQSLESDAAKKTAWMNAQADYLAGGVAKTMGAIELAKIGVNDIYNQFLDYLKSKNPENYIRSDQLINSNGQIITFEKSVGQFDIYSRTIINDSGKSAWLESARTNWNVLSNTNEYQSWQANKINSNEPKSTYERYAFDKSTNSLLNNGESIYVIGVQYSWFVFSFSKCINVSDEEYNKINNIISWEMFLNKCPATLLNNAEYNDIILKGDITYNNTADIISTNESSISLLPTIPLIDNTVPIGTIVTPAISAPYAGTVPIDVPITVPIDPPIDVPVDPPVEPTLIGTVAAILAGLTPIAGFLEYILAGQVSLTESIEAGLTGVIDGIGDIAGTLTGGITSSLTDIQSSISTLTAPATETINLDPVKNIPKVLFTKFPFSIPWDLYNVYNLMATDNRSPPEFLLGIQMSKSSTLSSLGAGDINMEVKLENYEQIAGIIRVGELLLFVLGLIFATKKLIWG